MDINPRYHIIEQQIVTLQRIDAPGWILDVGGGGEGVIGQMYGERVVAIDRLRYELEDAPGSPLKIVMDAKDLQFLDNTFQTATAFFFFMFAMPEDRVDIFKEIYRVLRPGGKLLLWELVIPPFPGGEKDRFIMPLRVVLPNEEIIETGYGRPWPDCQQAVDDYVRMAGEAGFTIKTCQETGSTFAMQLVKE
jgi:ubiquinone/menaquinone biosynthesis C-methylase UbiE